MIRKACMMALALTCLGLQARADDCGPLKQFASLDLIPAGGSGQMLVPVTINGTRQQMVLATAGGISSLRQDAMDRLGLHPIDASHIRLLSSNGTASQSFVQVDFQNFDLFPVTGISAPLGFLGRSVIFGCKKMQLFCH